MTFEPNARSTNRRGTAELIGNESCRSGSKSCETSLFVAEGRNAGMVVVVLFGTKESFGKLCFDHRIEKPVGSTELSSTVRS